MLQGAVPESGALVFPLAANCLVTWRDYPDRSQVAS